MRVLIGFVLSISIAIIMISCGGDDGPTGPEIETPMTPSFDREAILASWADNIIIPSFEKYTTDLTALKSSKDQFLADPTDASLATLRSAWIKAYKSWQWVSIYDIGKAEEIGLRNFTNIYPTDVAVINDNIQTQDYNLALPSNFVSQGFPALDYMLYGLVEAETDIVIALSSDGAARYLSDVVDRLESMGSEVYSDWESSYRSEFVSNAGSSATASTDKMVNDFLFYYERFLRAGKIGIPAGVFSGSALSGNVEAPYSGIYSKDLFLEGFAAAQNFFKGINFATGANGIGLDDYLDNVSTQNNTADISAAIISQWASAESKAQNLSSNLKEQVESDNSKMLEVYDELQKAVVLLKVDMLQALNIQVDFVDADGD